MPTDDFTPSFPNSLYWYYNAFSAKLEQERRAKILAVTTSEQAQTHVASVRKKLQQFFCADDLPQGVHPPRVAMTFQANGLLIDKVILEPRQGIYAGTLFLRREDITAPVPGVLGVCGHAIIGKEHPAYQAFAINLAKLGFGVLLLDPPCQGDARQFPPEPSATREHLAFGKAARACGMSPAAIFIHDARRAIDYLLSRPEIRPGKIAVTGNSGGGQMTGFLLATDNRIEIAAASCWMNTFRTLFRCEMATDSESLPEDMAAMGLDRPDLAIAAAPTPLLLLGASNDAIDPRGLKRAFAEIQHIYHALQADRNLELYFAPGEHGYNLALRQRMYNFMTRHYFGHDAPPEFSFDLLTSQQCQALPPNAELPGFLTERHFAIAHASRKRGKRPKADVTGFLRKVLRLDGNLPPPPDYRTVRSRWLNDTQGDARFVIESEPGTTISPVLHHAVRTTTPLIPPGECATLHIAHVCGWRELVQRAAEPELFVLDVRGVGESCPNICHGGHNSFLAPLGYDAYMDLNGMLLGQPLLNGRIRDVLSTIALFLSLNYQKITLSGRGLGGLLAAYAAAAVALPIHRLVLSEVPDSLEKLISQGVFRCLNSYLPAGLLTAFDLPDLYQHLQTQYPHSCITTAFDVPEQDNA